nr:ceramide kinase-like isoform X3 [Pocillopora verrucosa]
MNEISESERGLKAVFKVQGKLYDVYLDENEIVWTLQGELSSASSTRNYNLSTRSVKLSDIIGAWIAKRRIPRNESKDGELVGFTIFTFQKAENRKLCEARITFESEDQNVCDMWVVKINDTLKSIPSRPRKLKVVINPRSKKGEARLVYLKKVAPLFEKAGIRADLMMTQWAGHAWEFFQTAELSTYDGVVCVGGDGIVHEVVNGLLEKSHGNVGIDLVDGTLPEKFSALPLSMRIGIIPAGHTISLDICSLWSDNKHIRFTFSLAYGFLGDVLKTSEQHRWMGPKRYKWGAVRRLWKLRSYDVEVKYLLSPYPEHHPRDNTRCRIGCEVCSKEDDQDWESEQNQEWKSFHSRVYGVNFYTLPNLCEISPEGPSPCCHLGDGFTDLVIIKDCSRLQLKSHIQRNFNYKDQFAFGFIETHRVKECHIHACDKSGVPVSGTDSLLHGGSYRGRRNPKEQPVGVWNVDGEVLRQASLSLRVHRQIVTIFGSGIEDVSQQKCRFLK